MDALKKTMQLKAELDALRPLSKADEMRIMQKFRLDWNYHSNNLEGNSLTFGETKALIYHGITAQGKPLKDHFEITGHNEAIEMVLDFIKQARPLTETFIRGIHELLLKESYQVDAITPEGKPTKKWVKVGEYKSSDNHVETSTGEIFRFATHQETPAKMEELVAWYRGKIDSEEVNYVLLAAEFHYRFIRIHPFDDGNGRTARILMNFILMQGGYPPVVIKTEDKENYFAALRQADVGIFDAFLQYIVANLNWSLGIMLSGARGESIEEEDDLEKEIALLEMKLNEIGSTPKIYRSMDSIWDIFQHSVQKAKEEYWRKSKSLAKFYNRRTSIHKIDYGRFKDFVLPKDPQTPEDLKPSNPSKTLKKLPLTAIRLQYGFSQFNRKGFSEFSYNSEIIFNFYRDHFKVGIATKEFVSKPYGQQLTEEEIKDLVNFEIRRHKDFIEQKIKEKLAEDQSSS